MAFQLHVVIFDLSKVHKYLLLHNSKLLLNNDVFATNKKSIIHLNLEEVSEMRNIIYSTLKYIDFHKMNSLRCYLVFDDIFIDEEQNIHIINLLLQLKIIYSACIQWFRINRGSLMQFDYKINFLPKIILFNDVDMETFETTFFTASIPCSHSSLYFDSNYDDVCFVKVQKDNESTDNAMDWKNFNRIVIIEEIDRNSIPSYLISDTSLTLSLCNKCNGTIINDRFNNMFDKTFLIEMSFYSIEIQNLFIDNTLWTNNVSTYNNFEFLDSFAINKTLYFCISYNGVLHLYNFDYCNYPHEMALYGELQMNSEYLTEQKELFKSNYDNMLIDKIKSPLKKITQPLLDSSQSSNVEISSLDTCNKTLPVKIESTNESTDKNNKKTRSNKHTDKLISIIKKKLRAGYKLEKSVFINSLDRLFKISKSYLKDLPNSHNLSQKMEDVVTNNIKQVVEFELSKTQ